MDQDVEARTSRQVIWSLPEVLRLYEEKYGRDSYISRMESRLHTSLYVMLRSLFCMLWTTGTHGENVS